MECDMGRKKIDSVGKPLVPVEVKWVLKHGKCAYKFHPTFEVEPDDECMEIYLLCGIVIRDRDAGKNLWAKYRGELLRKPGVQSWWGFKQFEAKREKQTA